jgi:hypothetical protein
MKFSKFIAAVTFSVLSINTFATDISGEVIMDNYVGAGNSNDVYGNNHVYDIDKMIVDRDVSGGVTTLSVDIFTSFYNNNYQYSGGNSRIRLGDLFMSADDNLNGTDVSPWDPSGTGKFGTDRFTDTASASNTGTNWNYAYDLSGQRKNVYSEYGQLKTDFGSNQVISSTDWHGSSARTNQAVMLDDGNDTKVGDQSRWDLYHNVVSYTKNGINYGKLSLSFDVTGTDLATANQIAFRWAMTCANDIIEGLADFSPNTPPGGVTVPEPNTIILMLLAMAGLIYRKKVNS